MHSITEIGVKIFIWVKFPLGQLDALKRYLCKPNLPNFAPFQNGNRPIRNPIIKTGVKNASGSLFWPDLASSGPLLRSARR